MCWNAFQSWYSPLPTTASSISCSCMSISSFSVCAKTYSSTLPPVFCFTKSWITPFVRSDLLVVNLSGGHPNSALSRTGRITLYKFLCFVFKKPAIKFSSFFVSSRPFLLEQFHLFFKITEITCIRKPALKNITTYFSKDIRTAVILFFKSSLILRPTSLLSTFFFKCTWQRRCVAYWKLLLNVFASAFDRPYQTPLQKTSLVPWF